MELLVDHHEEDHELAELQLMLLNQMDHHELAELQLMLLMDHHEEAAHDSDERQR